MDIKAQLFMLLLIFGLTLIVQEKLFLLKQERQTIKYEKSLEDLDIKYRKEMDKMINQLKKEFNRKCSLRS